jgi:hypothetical protein
LPRKAASVKPWFVNQPLSTEWFSDPYAIDYDLVVGITMDVSGVTSNEGRFFVQASNDNSSWYDLNVYPAIFVGNVNNSFNIHLHSVPYRWLRMHFVPAGISPDGVASSIISAKSEC